MDPQFHVKAIAAPKTYNWSMKDYVFSLYIDTVSQKKIMIISTQDITC